MHGWGSGRPAAADVQPITTALGGAAAQLRGGHRRRAQYAPFQRAVTCSGEGREQAAPGAQGAGRRASPALQRFTIGTRVALHLSEEEARRMALRAAGEEHLLLGLLSQHSGTAAKALRALGVTLDGARAEVARVLGSGPGVAEEAELPLTPLAERALLAAEEMARQLGAAHVGTEHLLLALLRSGGLACHVLEALGAHPLTAQMQVECMLGRLDDARLARTKWAFVRAVSRAASGPALHAARQPWWRLLLLGDAYPLEGFAPEAQRAFALAEEEARRLGHPTLGPHHLLLGLVWGAAAGGATGQAFRSCGITLHSARQLVEDVFGGSAVGASAARPPRSQGHSMAAAAAEEVPWARSVEATMELAHEAAQELGEPAVSSASVLLGLLWELECAEEGTEAHALWTTLQLRVHPCAGHIMRTELLRHMEEAGGAHHSS